MQAENTNQSKQFLSDDLLDIIGDQDPFTDDLEQKVYYSEEGRSQRLNLMLHLAPYGGAMLLSGEKGIGKTALLYQFFARLGESCQAISLDASFAQSAELILKRIQEKVFWQSQLHEDSLTSLRRFLLQQRSQGKMLVLVIDNAHELDDSALNMLASLVAENDSGEKQITLILSGEPLLKERLAAKPFQLLQSQLVHSVDLAPFTEEDTAAYILHRLTIYGEADALKASLYKSIYASSLGVPSRINEFARLVWDKNRGVVTKQKVPKDASSKLSKFKLILPGVAVAVVVVLMLGNNQGWFGVQEMSDADSSPVTVEADNTPIIEEPMQLAVSQPKKSPAPVIALTDLMAEVGADITTDEVEVTLESRTENVEQENDSSLNTASVINPNDETLRAAIKKTASETSVENSTQDKSEQITAALIDLNENVMKEMTVNKAKDVAGADFREEARDEIRDETKDGTSLETVKLKSIKQDIDAPSKLSEDEVPMKGVEKNSKNALSAPSKNAGLDSEPVPASVQPQQAIPVVSAAKPAAEAIPDKTRTDEAWLQSQQTNHFTLQLMAMDEAAVRAFAAKNNLDDARYFWTMAGGKDVLAVVLGDFQSREQAVLNSKALGEKIPGLKPWVRTFASVQAALKDFQNLSQVRQRLELYAEHEAQLLALDPNVFTLQLMAMEERKVLSFVERNSLEGDMRYFRTTSKNQPLLALVLGVYKNRAEAQQSADLLQKSLRGVTPWLRQLSSVQQAIGVRTALNQ